MSKSKVLQNIDTRGQGNNMSRLTGTGVASIIFNEARRRGFADLGVSHLEALEAGVAPLMELLGGKTAKSPYLNNKMRGLNKRDFQSLVSSITTIAYISMKLPETSGLRRSLQTVLDDVLCLDGSSPRVDGVTKP